MKIDLLLMSSSDESGKLLLDRSSPGVSYELKRQATSPPCVQHTVLGQGLHVCKHFCRKMGDGEIVAFLTWSKSEIFMSCGQCECSLHWRLQTVLGEGSMLVFRVDFPDWGSLWLLAPSSRGPPLSIPLLGHI